MRTTSLTPTAQSKKRIQTIVREIVIKRDGGCYLQGVRFECETVLQAHHLITRGKNVGYADTRLIVCVCKAHHTAITFDKTGFYDETLEEMLPAERVALWKRVKKDQKPHPMSAYDWAKEEMALQAELKQLSPVERLQKAA